MPRCKVHFKKIGGAIEPAALTATFGELTRPAILGGNDSGRFSYWMAEPKEIFEFQTGEDQPFEKLQKVLERHKILSDKKIDLPKGIFIGGWVGYFSYELGRYIEKLPQRAIDDLKVPLIRLCFYDRLIAYDSAKNIYWAIALELEGDSETVTCKINWLLNRSRLENKKSEIKKKDKENAKVSKARSNINRNDYCKAIEKIKHYIYEGDVYQINFSHRFECSYKLRPIDLFDWQNEHNPSPYSAYIDAGDFTIVSASPEMFITLTDRKIQTKPIKGTRPRTGNSFADNKAFKELLECEKEKAELNMIIDLERNDLGRICEYGTIRVSRPRTIETYPTVFHAVATIEGNLRREINFCDVLKAMFPGGSITGAPKIRSMQIIDELEQMQRGVYTGSIGFIGVDGTVCLNIAIRTVIIRDGKAYAQTGGGIVHDSKPESEWQETIIKAKALLEGIEACSAKSISE